MSPIGWNQYSRLLIGWISSPGPVPVALLIPRLYHPLIGSQRSYRPLIGSPAFLTSCDWFPGPVPVPHWLPRRAEGQVRHSDEGRTLRPGGQSSPGCLRGPAEWEARVRQAGCVMIFLLQQDSLVEFSLNRDKIKYFWNFISSIGNFLSFSMQQNSTL